MKVLNNSLTHGQFLSPLEAWNLTSSKAANVIFSAVLTTILSYQLTALIFDLFFARRYRGRTSPSDMHIKLLTDEYSPLSITAAVFRRDFLDSRRLHIDFPRHEPINRSPATISKRVLFKFFVLLLAAPIFNLLCIIFTLDIDDTVTFAEANFGGLVLGVNSDLSTLENWHKMGSCSAVNTAVADYMQALATIYICSRISSRIQVEEYDPSKQRPDDMVSVSIIRDGSIDITQQSQLFPFAPDLTQVSRSVTIQRTNAFISVRGQQFHLASKMDVNVIHTLMALAKTVLETKCNSSLTVTSLNTFISKDAVNGSQGFDCASNEGTSNATNPTVASLSEKVTLVDVPMFQTVGAGRSKRTFNLDDGGDIPFLRRRRSIVSQGGLCVALAIVLFLRLFMRCFVVNDVENEIEDVVKRFLGIPWCDSLLAVTSKLPYDQKYYYSEEFHYGVPVKCDDLEPLT